MPSGDRFDDGFRQRPQERHPAAAALVVGLFTRRQLGLTTAAVDLAWTKCPEEFEHLARRSRAGCLSFPGETLCGGPSASPEAR